jgi:hypothetical protein
MRSINFSHICSKVWCPSWTVLNRTAYTLTVYDGPTKFAASILVYINFFLIFSDWRLVFELSVSSPAVFLLAPKRFFFFFLTRQHCCQWVLSLLFLTIWWVCGICVTYWFHTIKSTPLCDLSKSVELPQKKNEMKSSQKPYWIYIKSWYSRISKPCVTSPYGVLSKLYSCSLAINFRTQPTMPSVVGSFLAKPVMLPVPPRKTGSRNVIREKRPCEIWNQSQWEIRYSWWLSSTTYLRSALDAVALVQYQPRIPSMAENCDRIPLIQHNRLFRLHFSGSGATVEPVCVCVDENSKNQSFKLPQGLL